MANHDRQVLTRIILGGASKFAEAEAGGFIPSRLAFPEDADLLTYIADQVRNHGEVPTRDQIETKFPKFMLDQSDAQLSSLLEEWGANYARAATQTFLLGDYAPAVRDGASPAEMAEQVRKFADELASVGRNGHARLRVTSSEDIEPDVVRWFWEHGIGWIPSNSLTMVVGDPGEGKGLFSVWLASCATRGAQNFPKVNVGFLGHEDDPAIQRGRLLAAGAGRVLLGGALGVRGGGRRGDLFDGRDLCPVGHLQVGERLVLVNAFEATDRVPGDRDRVTADQRPVRGVPYTDVRVLSGDHNLVDAPLLQPLVEPGEVEGAVHTLGRDDLTFAWFQPRDDVGLDRAGHRMLSPHAQFGIVWLMRVVREHNHPALLARMREQPLQRPDDCLRLRIRQFPVDEVVEHVDDDQCAHFDLQLSPRSQKPTGPTIARRARVRRPSAPSSNAAEFCVGGGTFGVGVRPFSTGVGGGTLAVGV